MSDDSKGSSIYRFACPHCLKVLKIRTDWAGKKGVCPQCKGTVDFPAVMEATTAASPTTHQLLKIVQEQDNPAFDEAKIDKLALLFSQGTCSDYHLAEKLLLGDGKGLVVGLSPRQWRRTLNSADLRESMRLHIAQRIMTTDGADAGTMEPAAIAAASDNAAPNAWTILARFLYYQRHGICDACKINPTGLNCMYLTFDIFLAAKAVPASRVENWHKLLHKQLAL